MKNLEKLIIEYVGYSKPNTLDEVELEILGLKLAIKKAETRIALLQQGFKVGIIKKQEELSGDTGQPSE